ncbi:MAG: FAD-dependent oxidoreductase, partial [Proteobacteria bacterium]|nr:FAD-dependent oxidoreductase [Pseudomonadota bacterium]
MTAPVDARPDGDVLVLGAGLAGVCTAWALARDGAAVTVLDRRPGPAQETSFANGGHISAGQARPWATHGVPGQLLRWL